MNRPFQKAGGADVSLARTFAAWAARRCNYTHHGRFYRRKVVTFDDKLLFWRYEFLWPDEHITKDGEHICRPPWRRPFNIFLHGWRRGAPEEFHDHPRWSVTICLDGELAEITPWETRILRPGSVVFRSRKCIHRFEVTTRTAWTLFIVGRRNWSQNTYAIKSQSRVSLL